MYLSNITVKNIKTFKDVSVDLNNFNVLIGSCSSGKSNFVEIFKFIKDICDDFEKGIRYHAGMYLKNFNHADDPAYLKISFKSNPDEKYSLSILKDNEEILIQFNEFTYELYFNFNSEYSYEIINENVDFSYEYELNNEINKNNLIIENKEDIVVKLINHDDFVDIEDLIPNSILNIVRNKFNREKSLLINSSLAILPIEWVNLIRNIAYYNFYPKFVKFGDTANGESHLLEIGSNLAVILDNILKDDNNKKKFLNLVNYLLPYVKDINVEKLIDERRIFSIIEEYNPVSVPSIFVSDGTINIISLIVGLYFENELLILIEEPERNIHPELLSGLIQMMEEVSAKKQLIVTTHNPELLKHVNLNDIYFISRDEEGYSTINKPIDNEYIKPFIEELGIDEVFVDNYLGIK